VQKKFLKNKEEERKEQDRETVLVVHFLPDSEIDNQQDFPSSCNISKIENKNNLYEIKRHEQVNNYWLNTVCFLLIIYVKMFTVLILPVPRLSFNEFKIK
jgi:hypothetical protein